MGTRKPKIILLGMATPQAVAGPAWMTVQYLIGFERLGYEAYYVEAHARTPHTLMQNDDDDSATLAAQFVDRLMRRFGFAGRWAYHALHDDGRCYGMSLEELHRLYRSADLIVNLHGGTKPLPEHSETGRLIFLETDPVHLQFELARGDRGAIEYLEPHAAFFTFAENYGNPDCRLPVTELFEFRPTRPPVVLDFWEREGPPSGNSFRTIGNWRQRLDVHFEGDVYTWSKHHEFLKFIDLPRRTGQAFEPALSKVDEESQLLLEQHGWKVRDSMTFTFDLDAYRSFIHGARGEFTVAKDQNIRLRSGWFSERSANFLASGVPVVAQDTAFDCALPTGEGLFAFQTVEDATDAVEQVSADPARHGRAAFEIAREYFRYEAVLGRLLSDLGMPARVAGGLRPRPAESAHQAEPAEAPFPASLVVMPVSKHPTELDPATLETVMHRPIPATNGHRRNGGRPFASVVVVTRDNLPFTRMCLESVLDVNGLPTELIVIDNASGQDTQAYLGELRRQNSSVRVVFNRQNRSFAAAVNQGLELATGSLLAILNNDTIVTPGWLEGLGRHLEDPEIGLVGPVTNEAPNEARIEAPYRTYRELVDFARARADEHQGQAFDIPVATMFCAAMTSEAYAKVGPLDERYAVGLFEDDDYSLRMSTAGLRIVCAEDVYVHHFGKSSFGNLVPTGDYAAVFEANRRRFEQKWGREWKTHSRRPSDAWEDMVGDVRRLVDESIPDDAVVLVVSRGDESLLDLGPRTGWHFPRDDAGEHAGYYPTDSDEAIEWLAGLRARGATHLVFPSMELWWLDHYRELREHLETSHREAARTAAGVAYELLGV